MKNKAKVIYKNYVEVNDNKYFVDGRKVVLNSSKIEIALASWLSTVLNVRVEILPKINLPKGIQTSDYLIDNERWDLKRITSSRNNAIHTCIRNKKGQSSNFIFDISMSRLSVNSAKKQICGLSSDFFWFKKAIIKKNKEYIVVDRKIICNL